MHSYPVFEMSQDECRALIAERRFATLVVNGANGPLVAHLPMILSQHSNGTHMLEGHIARTNPIAGISDETPALAIFNGPDAYVAAGFYPSKARHGRVAPTWNYIAVHASGPLSCFSGQQALVAHLEEMTSVLEQNEPAPWAVSDAPPGFAEGLSQGIMGVRMAILNLEGMEKLSQNSRPDDRAGVLDGLRMRAAPGEADLVTAMAKKASKPAS